MRAIGKTSRQVYGRQLEEFVKIPNEPTVSAVCSLYQAKHASDSPKIPFIPRSFNSRFRRLRWEENKESGAPPGRLGRERAVGRACAETT